MLRRRSFATVVAGRARHWWPTTCRRWVTPTSPRWPAVLKRGRMKACRLPNLGLLLVFLLLLPACACAKETASPGPPQIPFGLDAFTQWQRWPYLRIGVRCYMRSTFDRRGGNDNADAAHFIRQIDDAHNVAVDELGPGILWFVRYNHWHGSPWQYLVDDQEHIVQETSTRDPLHPAKNSVF